MAKHIHIHVHKTKDADGPAHAPAGSSKGGQFVSSGGATSAKGAAEHHSQKQGEHATHAQSKKLTEAQQESHEKASYHHGEAAEHFTTAAVTSKTDKAHGNAMILGNHHAALAEKHGSEATPKEPKYTPMRQANRNLEAQQLKESKKIAKQPVSPGINPGIRQMQAKSDVEEAKKRIAAKKKPVDLNNPSPAHKGAMTKAKANGGGSKKDVDSWAARAASESNRK